jgi:hypothetical protein
MKLRTLMVPWLGLCSWTSLEAATVLASYGAYEQNTDRESFFTLEAFSNKRNYDDFEFTSVNHVKGQTINDSVEVISRGLAFDFELLRLNFDIGYFFSLDKYALDEIDYGISRSIIGGGLSLDLKFIELHGHSRSYIPYGSAKTKIDSFTLSYNPYPYQQSQAGLTIRLGFLELQGDVGRFDRLRGRYDILEENFMLTLPAVSYGKATVVLKGSKHSVLRLEVHKILDDHDRREDFHKLIGTAMHREAYDGGSLGIGFSF